MNSRRLILQLQPRADGADEGVSTYLRDVLARVVAEFIEEADEVGQWRNFEFETNEIDAMWSALRAELATDTDRFAELQTRWIVVAEGNHGWDDYLMLAHFDPTVRVD